MLSNQALPGNNQKTAPELDQEEFAKPGRIVTPGCRKGIKNMRRLGTMGEI